DNFEASANYKAGFNTKSNSGAIVPVMPFDIVVAPLDNPSNYKAMNAGKKQKNAPANNTPNVEKHDTVVVKN
ncbi:MAG: hypothetical protein NW207_00210, partial [Cytophagales bacterium]|nr:hypothetical protein [Cytophagales bacterium]